MLAATKMACWQHPTKLSRERQITSTDSRRFLKIVIGLPLSLSGEHTASTNDALEVARAIASVTEIPVRLIDERLTTVSAHSAMKAVGKNQKKSRPVIDQVAAVLILQQALDSERSTGQLAGKALSEFPEQA